MERVESRHVIDALKNVPRRELDQAAEAFAKFDPDRIGVITLEDHQPSPFHLPSPSLAPLSPCLDVCACAGHYLGAFYRAVA